MKTVSGRMVRTTCAFNVPNLAATDRHPIAIVDVADPSLIWDGFR